MGDVSQLCRVSTSDAKRFIEAAVDNKMVYEEKSSASSAARPVHCSDMCQRSLLVPGLLASSCKVLSRLSSLETIKKRHLVQWAPQKCNVTGNMMDGLLSRGRKYGGQ